MKYIYIDIYIFIHKRTIYNSQVVGASQVPPEDELINKMCILHMMEYYSSLAREESLPHATTCMELENIKLSETSQSEKDKFHL